MNIDLSFVTELIKQPCLEVLNGQGEFLKGRRIDLSLKSIDTKYPLFYVAPFDGRFDKDLDFATVNIILSCWLQDSPDASPEQSSAVVNASFSNAMRVYELLKENDEIDVEAITIFEEHVQWYSGTVSGYSIKFTINAPIPC